MLKRTLINSEKNKILAYKLDPGVFVVEIPENGRKISLGQPPDAVKRFQQVGYAGENGIDTFVLADSKVQGDSISWCLLEFPILYALYFIPVKVNGKSIPAFFAGKKPMIIGLQNDIKNTLQIIKYANYGVDSLEEFNEMDIPEGTRDALIKEIPGLAVGNKIMESESYIETVPMDHKPKGESDFSSIGDGITIGRIGYNQYRFIFKDDSLDINVSLSENEKFRSPVEYKHFKFPVSNFGIWHTGEYDGMAPYISCAHTSIIHKYEPFLIDYPSNITNIINHHGLSKQSINRIFITHCHDDHIGGVVELFRRSGRCNIITTEPVRHSLIKKLSALVNLPEGEVAENFTWTILPFLKDNPYQTETINIDGIWVTGHLSCHAVPTTVYTFQINNDGYVYKYGHFLDIVAFKRMKMLVDSGWMPKNHLDYLDKLVRGTRYNLIKYDVGCINDESVPFTVHGQWQDLKGAQTERPFRVFTHAIRTELDPDYEQEGRFVSIGDLDSTVRTGEGRLVRLGADKQATTAFYYQSYLSVMSYFESLLGSITNLRQKELMNHYANTFANCPKQPDPNIGTFLFEQGDESREVIIIIRGRAEIIQLEGKELLFRSVVGDGEVLGDVGVITNQPRMATLKSLNRLSYLSVPANLFLEATKVLGISYEGYFKELFERRMLFQSVADISQDVSTIVLNNIARESKLRQIKENENIYEVGQKDEKLIIARGSVELKMGDVAQTFSSPVLIGEYEFMAEYSNRSSSRLHSARALESMELLEIDFSMLRSVPVIVDNIRRAILSRRTGIYDRRGKGRK